MRNKILKFILMIVCVIALLPHSVHAEGGSSPILPTVSHGNVIKTMNLADYTSGITTNATLQIYEDGYTVVKSNSTVEQSQKIDNVWVINAIKNYYDGNPTVDMTSLVYDSDTRLLVSSLSNVEGGFWWRFRAFWAKETYGPNGKIVSLSKLKEIDLSKTTPITDAGQEENTDSTRINLLNTFSQIGIEKLIFGQNWSKIKIGDISNLFYHSIINEVVGLEYMDIKPTSTESAFSNATIKKIDLSKLDLTSLRYGSRMFDTARVDFKDLFSRQHINNLKSGRYMFSLYVTDEPLDVTGIDLANGGGSGSDYQGMFSALQAPSFKFDFRNACSNTGEGADFSYAFSRLSMQIDTSKLPKLIYKPVDYDSNGSGSNIFYMDMLSYNSSWWEVYQKSLDLSDYSTDYIGSTNVLDNQSGVQVIKTSTRTKLHPQYGNGLGIGSYSIFDKYVGFKQVYTGRWLLKYYSDGSVVPEADRKYASTYADFNGIDGYWVREPVAGDNSPTLSGGRIYETEDDKWVTNADGSMTYNMKVFDRKDTHYIVEDENPNYIRTDSTTRVNGKQASTAVVGKDETTATVVNKYINSTNTEVRNLTIRKNVDVEDSTQFIFDVTLKHSTLSGIKKINDILFKDGVGTITLMGNKSITLELPKGTEYTITERAVKNWTLTSQENTSGTLDLNTEAVFTNTRDTFPNVSDSVTELNIEKNVPESYKGFNGNNGFQFEITLSNLSPNSTYQYEQFGQTKDFTSDENGLANLSLSISKTSPVKIIGNGISSFKYSIREKAPNAGDTYTYIPSMRVYEDTSLMDNVGGKNGIDFVSKTYTAKTGKINRAVITNDIYDLYQYNLSKVVEGSDTEEPFNFTISIKGLKKGDRIYYVVYGEENKTVEARGDEYTEFNIKLSNGSGIDIFNIPTYAEVSAIEHANTKGFVSNYQDMNDLMTDNTTVGKEMATPYIAGNVNNSYVGYVFYNRKEQTIVTSKTVTGNQGDKYKDFDFNAKFFKEDGSAYTGKVVIARKNGTKEELTPNSENVYTYQMKHGDVMQLSNFEEKIKSAEITEADNEYDTTVQEVGKDAVNSKTITVDVENSDKQVNFTNNLGINIPTGIALPLGGIALLAVGMLIIIINKKKRED